MKAIWIRVGVNLAAIVLLSLALAYILYVFGVQAQVNMRQKTELEALAWHSALKLPQYSKENSKDIANHCAQSHQTYPRYQFTLIDHQGRSICSSSPVVPLAELPLDGYLKAGTYSHMGVLLPSTSSFSRWIVSISLADSMRLAIKMQSSVIPFFLLIWALSVVIGLILLRGALIRPISRLLDLLRDHPLDGDELVLPAATTLGEISHSIFRLTQALARDKEKLGEQYDSLQQAHRELEAAQAHLLRSERLAVVGQLAAGIAHEIGNPLAILIGYVEILEDEDLTQSDRLSILSRMGREVERLHSIVRHMLDFSRASESVKGSGDARLALEHSVELVRPQKSFLSMQIEVDFPVGDYAIAMATGAVEQVILNLLLNAADSTEDDGIIALEAELLPEWIQIRVEDNGPGFAPGEEEEIFKPFYSTKEAGKGTGLGLTVCEQILSNAGGSITAGHSSRLGGASFTLRLPREVAPD